jgi:hypothetical protein
MANHRLTRRRLSWVPLRLAGAAPAADREGRGAGWKVAAFFLTLCLFVSSGRLNSDDACGQLDAAMLLLHSGRLGTTVSTDAVPQLTPETSPWGPNYQPHVKEAFLWVHSPSGELYEAHDLGLTLFMLAPAGLTAKLVRALGCQDPTLVAQWLKLGIASAHAGLAALGCLLLFQLFRLWTSARTAFLLSLA